MENAHNFEKDVEKLIVKQLKNHAMYTQYLSKIQGIGPMLSAGLIAYIDDIEKFDHVSSLWQYCGYGAFTAAAALTRTLNALTAVITGSLPKENSQAY